MNCKSCNREVSANMFFCPFCGASVSDSEVTNKELLQSYSANLQKLMKNVGTASFTKIAWDTSVEKYVGKMERLRMILQQPEFSNKNGSGLIKRIDNFILRCKEPEFHIAFVGTIKAGKSTLINALLGRNLASTSVTPETAVLTKFRNAESDYVRVVFYSPEEWQQLWNSASNAEIFKKEYAKLNGDAEKSKWIGHTEIKTKVTKDNIEAEVERWTSSKHVEHYFVKEVEIGLSDFQMPPEVVFVDTPGLDDPVRYRSDVTRNYIERANAVFVCVRCGALTTNDLSILYKTFTNSMDNPEKIFVLGTHWDSFNHPEADWKKQKEEWVKYLSTESTYGSEEKARRNIIHVAAFIMNQCRDYVNLDEEDRNLLISVAMKIINYKPLILPCPPLEERLEELMEKSNVNEVNRKITQGIVPKYKDYLMKDITSNYEALSTELRKFFEETRSANAEVLSASKKSADEIRAKYEKSKKELEEVLLYRQQLETALKAVRENTQSRVDALCKEIDKMVQSA